MCFIHQLHPIALPAILQAANVAGHGVGESERRANAVAESGAWNVARRHQRDASGDAGAGTDARPTTAAAAGAIAVPERRVASRTTAALPDRAGSAAELHSVAPQPTEPDAGLPQKPELRNLFRNVCRVRRLAQPNHRFTRICTHVDIAANSTRARLELIAADEDAAPYHHAVGEVDAGSETNSTNCRRTISAFYCANHADFGAAGSTILPNVLATEASHATYATADATDPRHQLRKQHKVPHASVDAGADGQQQQWRNERQQLADDSHDRAAVLRHDDDGAAITTTTATTVVVNRPQSTAALQRKRHQQLQQQQQHLHVIQLVGDSEHERERQQQELQLDDDAAAAEVGEEPPELHAEDQQQLEHQRKQRDVQQRFDSQ